MEVNQNHAPQDILQETEIVRAAIDEMLTEKFTGVMPQIVLLCFLEAVDQMASALPASQMKEAALSIACLSGAVAQNSIDAERRALDAAAAEIMQELQPHRTN
jgi:hypothetical protein